MVTNPFQVTYFRYSSNMYFSSPISVRIVKNFYQSQYFSIKNVHRSKYKYVSTVVVIAEIDETGNCYSTNIKVLN